MFLLLMGGVFHSARANCIFLSGGDTDGVVTFQLPAVIMVDPDAPVGTVLYDQNAESGLVLIQCSGEDEQIHSGYLTLTDADSREDVLPGVYKTNVPGVGLRAAASSERLPDYNGEDIVRPWRYVGMRHGSTSGRATFRAAAQLVVTGNVEDGYLDTSRLIARDTLGGITIGEMRFSPAQVHIVTNTCNLVDRNIFVPLKTINVADFDGQYSDILTDSSFKIAVKDCRAGTKIDYQFNSGGSTGVTNGNVLAIQSGDVAASGLGIQILDSNNNVLSFDQSYTAIASTHENQTVDIPLKARYIKTGEVRAGKVDAVATFEVFYR